MHSITLIPKKSQVSNDVRKKAPNVDDLSDEIIIQSELFRKLSVKPIQLSFIPTLEMPIDLGSFTRYFNLSDKEIKYIQQAGSLQSIVQMQISVTGLVIFLDL